MRKAKVNPRVYSVLALREKDASQKVSLGNMLYTFMQSNPFFINPTPSMAEIKAATDKLSAALAVGTAGSDLQKAELATAENEFDNLAGRVQNYIHNIANADFATASQVILSTGLPLRKPWKKSSLPDAVSVIKAIYTYQAGTILVKWKGVKRARAYQLFMSTDPSNAASFQFVAASSEKSVLVKNLQTATMYHFKVVVITRAGQSVPSQIASCLAA